MHKNKNAMPISVSSNPSTIHDIHAPHTTMSASSTPSTLDNDRLLRLNRENSSALIEVLLKYDEFHTLLSDAGHDTTALQAAIKSALQSSVLLLCTTNDILKA